MQIIVNKLLTQYELVGTGKLIVLLHGWGDSSKGLAALQNALAANNQVLAIDLPGFGGTQVPTTVWDLDNYAGFVAAVIQKIGLAEPYAVIGHSNGGAIAIRGIANGTLQPQKLVLLASSGIRDAANGKRAALQLFAKVGNVATLWLPAGVRTKLRKKLYGAAGSDMLVVPELQETFKKTVRQDVQQDAAKITVPTLLIYGQNDRATPPVFGERYHTLIAGSKLLCVPNAGHFVYLDQPDIVTKSIKEFL